MLRTKLILLVQWLGLTADQLKVFTIPLIIFKMTGSVSMSGLAYCFELLPKTIFSPIMGSLIDRFNFRKQLLLIEGMRTLIILMIVMLIRHVSAIFVLSGFVGLGSIYAFIALESIAGKLLQTTQYVHFQSRSQFIDPISRALGASLGALLLIWLPLNDLLFFVMSIYLCSFICIYFGTHSMPVPEKDNKKLHFMQDIKLGFKLIAGNSKLLLLTVFAMGTNFIQGVAQSVMPAMVTHHFALSNRWYSVPNASAGVAALIGIMFMPKLAKQLGIQKIGIIGCLFFIVSIVLFVLAPYFWIFTLGYVFSMMSVVFYGVYFRTKRLEAIPAVDYGKVLGVSIFLTYAALPFSGLLTYFLGHKVQPQMIILMAALTFFVVFSLFLAISFKGLHKIIFNVFPQKE